MEPLDSISGTTPFLTEVDEDALDDGGELEKWASPNRWQTSTPEGLNRKNHNPSRRNLESRGSLDEKRQSSDLDEPTSPNEWSHSADAPLLANTDENPDEDDSLREDEKTSPPVASGAEYKVAFSHFTRIFTYSTWGDKVILLVATIASICTGVMLPIMNVVFG